MSIDFSPELIEFVDGLGQVDILSTTAMSLLRELSAGDLSSKQLGIKISQDPTLSASLLKLANSAFYGIPNRVSTVNHAVSLLGFTAVRNLVQGLCLIEFNHPDVGLNDDAKGSDFSAHSMAVSKMAGFLTKKFGFPTIGQGEAETAGLLHDIGFLLMAATKSEEFVELVKTYRERKEGDSEDHPDGVQILDLEKEKFGFAHPELGAWLAQKWNLPLMIQEALMFHHGDISDCLNRESATIIQLANLICNENEMGYIPEGFWGDADPSVLRFLDSQRKLETYESFPHSLQKEIDEVKQLYDFVFSGMKGTGQPAPAEQPPNRDVSKPSELKPKPISQPSVSSWTLLVPGLPHFYSDNTGLGGALMGAFAASVVGCGFGLSSGNMTWVFGALAVAGISWIVSIMTS